jgi:hypothetical protein
MKKKSAFLSGAIKFLLCLFIVFQITYKITNSQTFRLFAVSDMVRIFEDGYKMPPMYDTIKLFGIRGETVSGQFVVTGKKSLYGVTVDMSTLQNQSGSTSLPSGTAEWNYVGCIPLTKNTPNQPLSALNRPAPARFPEYLMSEKLIDVKEKNYQSVWLTVRIPGNAEAGLYKSRITVKCNNEEQSLPVSLIVYPFTLPAERHLKIVEWYSTEGFERFHGISKEYSEEWFGMLRKYAENMAEHRQNIFRVPMEAIEIRKSNSGNLEFDFKRFDQIAQVFWDTKKMDGLETGFLANFGEKDWFSNEVILKDFKISDSKTGEKITLKGEEVVPFLLPAFESHLRQKNWLSKTLFHIRDEPSVHNAIAWMQMSEYLHKYAPDLIRIDAIETTFLLDDIEVAVPKLDHFATWNESYKNWQKKGHEVWFYTVGIYQGSLFPDKTIDMPVIDSRIMHWLNYKYDATGYLHWGWNQWNENPYQDVGEHIGDAWHVYPVKDGVLNSLRWEQMRNGIQDYEYLWMVENKINALRDSLGSRFSWINPKQRGKEIAGEVVKGFADHTDDPQVLNSAKMKIIRELLYFNKSPEVYVQTNPPEHSLMTVNSSVEVLGWTEPGTKIIVNGKVLPVNNQGLFVEQFEVSVKSNLIKVQATGSAGSKEIVREFVVRER